jgi:outer membrane protein OmpA-like peptidoglycan-associated protein
MQMNNRLMISVFAMATLSACETTAPPPPATAPVAVAQPPAPTPAPAPPVPPPPLVPLPFEEAATAAANALLSSAAANASGRRTLVIDPLIDAVSGMESAQTRALEKRIVDLVKERYPQFDVRPFNVASVAQLPVVLVGTFTAIDSKNQVRTNREQFRICLALADLGSGKILSKGVARSTLEGVDIAPTAFYRDSPVWAGEDPAITSYVRTCQATKAGDSIDPVYLQRIATAALVNEAIDLFEAENFKAANELFRSAAQTPAGAQLRVLNGWFLSSWRLNRSNDVVQAAGRLAEYGLERRTFSMMFLFPAGRAEFSPDRRVSGSYPILLREIARKTAGSKACLDVVGHASRSGPEAVNERLSLARATYVKTQLERAARPLAKRMAAMGVGSREWLVGTGSDDLVDAIDRRVQLKVADCPA